MILIIDTNIVMSALIKDSLVRELLIDSPFVLYMPETALSEIRKHENLILQKSELTKHEFEELLNIVISSIEIIEKDKYKHKMEEAKQLLGHIDKGDVPFIALALSLTNDGIWTEDKHFEKQDKVKIWKTEDIIKLLF